MEMDLTIHKIKCVNDVNIVLPVQAGLYGITGQNGSGKSTIVTCASSVFFDLQKDEYFGHTDTDSYIEIRFDGRSKKWYKDDQNNWVCDEHSTLGLQGFYEGSLIFGNRFKDTSYEKLHELEKIDETKLNPAAEFIRKNMGAILQGDDEYYEKLWRVPFTYGRFKSDLFFYEKNGKKVSQFHMSTGENLLVSILNSLFIKNKQHEKKAQVYFNRVKGQLIFLDEIELALHPSSLNRLIRFLEDMSNKYGYAIYFSTHSIELIGCIKPENIYYIQRHADNSTEVINPCYPAFATRNLYNHEGYDKVILVEDDLAKGIVNRLLRVKRLLSNRLVHVLPCGGYQHVIDFADDVVCNNLLGRKTSVCMVLDRDVKKDALNYRRNTQRAMAIQLNFLPVPSLEKYLREVLVLNVDHNLFRLLGDYIFQQKSLADIIDEYKKDKDFETDTKGKVLYGYLAREIVLRRQNREGLIEMIVDYWFSNRFKEFDELSDFLSEQLKKNDSIFKGGKGKGRCSLLKISKR